MVPANHGDVFEVTLYISIITVQLQWGLGCGGGVHTFKGIYILEA